MNPPRAPRLAGRFGAEWLHVPRAEDIRWLTGFSGSTATALVAQDGRVVLLVDGRYVERAADEAGEAGHEVEVVRTAGGARGSAARRRCCALSTSWVSYPSSMRAKKGRASGTR